MRQNLDETTSYPQQNNLPPSRKHVLSAFPINITISSREPHNRVQPLPCPPSRHTAPFSQLEGSFVESPSSPELLNTTSPASASAPRRTATSQFTASEKPSLLCTQLWEQSLPATTCSTAISCLMR